MQCMSYFPGHYSARDLNLEVKSDCCLTCNSDEIEKSERCDNGLSSSLASNQHLDFVKELLRQTMLKHEVIFKHQVRELHRVYRRQRELMGEIKWKELCRYNLQLETSYSYSFPSQISFESQKTWHMPSMPLENSSCSKAFPASAGNIQLPLCLTKEKSTQAGFVTAQTESGLNNCRMLESKTPKAGRKMLNLQLSANAYIDNEENESVEGGKLSKVPELSCHIKRDFKVFPEKDVKNCLACDVLSPLSHVRRTNGLADLKAPIKPEALSSISFLGPVPCDLKIPCGDQLDNINPGFQCKSCFQDVQTKRNAECSLNVPRMEKEQRGEWLPYGDEAEKFLKFKSSEVEFKKELSEIHLQSNRSESNIFALQVPRKSHDVPSSSSNSLKLSAILDVSSSHQLVPHADMNNSGSSPVSSWRKPVYDLKRTPIAVQALPCFNTLSPPSKRSKSSMGSSAEFGEKFHPTRKSSYSPCFGSAISSQNSSRHGTQLGSQTENGFLPSNGLDYVNCRKDNGCSSSQHYGCTTKNVILPIYLCQNLQATDGETKFEDSHGGLFWLREKPEHNSKPDEKIEDSNQRDIGFSQGISSCTSDMQAKTDEQSNLQNNEKIFGFPIHTSSASSSKSQLKSSKDEDTEKSNKVGVIDINVAWIAMPDSSNELIGQDVETRLEKKLSGSGDVIDLNCCLDEDEFSSTPVTEFEAPISPENKEHTPPRGDSEENQLEAPFQCSEQEDGHPLEENLVKIAAAALVSISASGVRTCLHTAYKPSECSLSDSLQWFASAVTSVVSDIGKELDTVSSDMVAMSKRSFSSPGVDYFEFMTLNLTEMKVEPYGSKTKEAEGAATVLPTKPRKGRVRIGRQWRDFQREILPCLMSLSRHEVTEDLQKMGGLVVAASTPFSTGSMKNASRNRWQNGKRRSRISAPDVVESIVCLPSKKQTDHIRRCLEDMSLIGWGKITRRRRGPRCPATNPPLIATKV